jgi:hypothetical protein
MTFLYRFPSVGKEICFSYTVVSPMTALVFLPFFLCRAIERVNSFAMPSFPKQCLQWTRSLAAQGGPHWKVAYPAKYWS